MVSCSCRIHSSHLFGYIHVIKGWLLHLLIADSIKCLPSHIGTDCLRQDGNIIFGRSGLIIHFKTVSWKLFWSILCPYYIINYKNKVLLLYMFLLIYEGIYEYMTDYLIRKINQSMSQQADNAFFCLVKLNCISCFYFLFFTIPSS